MLLCTLGCNFNEFTLSFENWKRCGHWKLQFGKMLVLVEESGPVKHLEEVEDLKQKIKRYKYHQF
jgi:hypothetical protein